MKYTEKRSERGEIYIELAFDDGRISLIPSDPANSDYQRYLRWLENPDADQSETL